MKHNVLRLLKIELLRFVSGLTSGKKARKTPLLYVLIFAAIFMVALSSAYSFLMISPFVSRGLDPTPAIALFAGVVGTFTFMTSLSQSRGIYIGDDYDLLSALPIKKRDVVASKILSLYATELLISLLLLLPHAVVMLLLSHNPALFGMILVLAITMPLVPMALSMLLSLLVALATARWRSANTLFVFVYVLLIVSISFMAMFIGRMDNTTAASAFASTGNILKWINPSFILFELALTSSSWWLLAYIGVNLFALIFATGFIALFFDKLHAAVSSVSLGKHYVVKTQKSHSARRALLHLEFRRLINSKIYFANCLLSGIMTIGGGLVFLLSFQRGMTSASAEAIEQMKRMAIPIFIAITVLIFGISHPSSGCINIEGKNFWLSKSLPLNPKDYLHTKLAFSLILTLPASLVASSIAIIFYHESVLDIVFAFLIPFLYVTWLALWNLIVALRHPKLRWNNEAEAVKNSSAVLVCLLWNLLFALLSTPLLILFPIIAPSLTYLGYSLLTALILIGVIASYIHLRKPFASSIAKIEDL